MMRIKELRQNSHLALANRVSKISLTTTSFGVVKFELKKRRHVDGTILYVSY